MNRTPDFAVLLTVIAGLLGLLCCGKDTVAESPALPAGLELRAGADEATYTSPWIKVSLSALITGRLGRGAPIP